MPQFNNRKPSLAVLAYELDQEGGVPAEAHLLPLGPFRAQDGRPEECDAWLLDGDIARRVIARAAQQQNDFLIDYEHQSIRSRVNGQKVPAAGWFKTLLWREFKGLYATDIRWTATARRMISEGEYRYISAVFFYDAVTGEVLEIVSVALTNTPALDGLEALADLSMIFTERGVTEMPIEHDQAALAVERDGLKTQVAALTAERDGLKTQVAALTQERDGLKEQVAAFEREKTEAALAAERAKHKELLEAALSDGRLAPAQKPWAEKQTLAALAEYLEVSSPLALLNKQTAGHKGGGHGLSQEELAVCAKMGVSPEDYAKSKDAGAR